MYSSNLNKKIITFLLLLIVIPVTTPIFAHAYFICYNPDSVLDVCEVYDIPTAQALELCCPDGCDEKYYDADEDVPYETLEEKCSPGCCFSESENSCMENTIQILCDGLFSDEADGLCKTDTGYVFPECSPKCCCTDSGYIMANDCDAVDGKEMENVDSQYYCSRICKSVNCIEGCMPEKPNYCKNNQVIQDCTGGDNIVGNGNDCGCPSGSECQRSGTCLRIASEDHSNLKNDTDTAEINCGKNSHVLNGVCVCDDGYHDNVCSPDNPFIDYDNDGCTRTNPCQTEDEKNSLFPIFITLILLFILSFVFIKKYRPDFRNLRNLQINLNFGSRNSDNPDKINPQIIQSDESRIRQLQNAANDPYFRLNKMPGQDMNNNGNMSQDFVNRQTQQNYEKRRNI